MSERPSGGYLDRLMAAIGGLALVLMMVLTVISTFSRFLLNRPVPDIVTIDEVLMVFIVFLPLAYVQLHKEHVEVTIFTDWLPPAALDLLRSFACLLGAAVFGLLGYALFHGAYQAWLNNDYFYGEFLIPSWPARLLAAVGMATFVVRLLLDAVHISRASRSRAAKSSMADDRVQVVENR